ncbi:hypothetical protein [Neorhizobium sp. NCHU2750]|uniref:hypothetical protein n=1 Tax=Neorhizobium sp. NCHU2750 TaxID=1825976 RepID=UPI000E7192D6
MPELSASNGVWVSFISRYGGDLMLRDFFHPNDLIRVSYILATDFGPSISVLIAVLAVGAWFLGVDFQATTTAGSGLAGWL